MRFNDLIHARRSIRAYASAATREELEAICAAAQQAPSWKNGQPARCYAVASPEKLEALREKGLPSFNRNSSANAALIVTTFVRGASGFSNGAPDNEVGDGWGAYDLGLHDAYLVLAASELGLDTLIMGIRDAAAIRELLAIPENEQIMSVIAVGRRAQDAPARPRKPLGEVAIIL